MSFNAYDTLKDVVALRKIVFGPRDLTFDENNIVENYVLNCMYVQDRGAFRWPPSYTADVQRKTSPSALSKEEYGLKYMRKWTSI